MPNYFRLIDCERVQQIDFSFAVMRPFRARFLTLNAFVSTNIQKIQRKSLSLLRKIRIIERTADSDTFWTTATQ